MSVNYPAGSIEITNYAMTDSIAHGTISVTSIEHVSSIGKKTPTAFISGRCNVPNARGCQFWMMIADNGKEKPPSADQKLKRTPDIVSFVVIDARGKHVAYGTGILIQGDITIAPSPN